MIKFPPQKDIVKAVLNGIVRAANNYVSWTNGRLFLSHGPQKIISIHVAQEIAMVKNAPEIFIDSTISDILKCTLKNREAYISYMKNRNLTNDTFNITLDERFNHDNDEDSISRVVITIRNSVRNVKIEYKKEIEQICKMIDKEDIDEHSLKYGIFGFYSDLSNNARKKLDKRLPDIVKSFDEIVLKYPGLKSKFVNSGIQTVIDSGEWVVGCYVIESK